MRSASFVQAVACGVTRGRVLTKCVPPAVRLTWRPLPGAVVGAVDEPVPAWRVAALAPDDSDRMAPRATARINAAGSARRFLVRRRITWQPLLQQEQATVETDPHDVH